MYIYINKMCFLCEREGRRGEKGEKEWDQKENKDTLS